MSMMPKMLTITSETIAVVLYIVLFAVTWGFLAIRHARKTGNGIEIGLMLFCMLSMYWPIMWIGLLIEFVYHKLEGKQ